MTVKEQLPHLTYPDGALNTYLCFCTIAKSHNISLLNEEEIAENVIHYKVSPNPRHAKEQSTPKHRKEDNAST